VVLVLLLQLFTCFQGSKSKKYSFARFKVIPNTKGTKGSWFWDEGLKGTKDHLWRMHMRSGTGSINCELSFSWMNHLL